MKRLIHLSDLHFGTEIISRLSSLKVEIKNLNPDIIVISGDLTQRATVKQYQAVSEFLNSLANQHIICVPGNHDISLYNMIERLCFPYHKYTKWIKSHFKTEYVDDDFAILGINSVTAFKIMGGYITKKQLNLIMRFFTNQQNKIKILVMHHNLIASERHKIINDSEKLINTLASCNVNLVLSGHIHHAAIELLKRNYLTNNLYVITAGTPISTRTTAPNSFNVIEFNTTHFTLMVKTYQNDQFSTTDKQEFQL